MISRFVILAVIVLGSLALHIEHEQASLSSASYTDAISDLSAFQKEVAANTQYSNGITNNADFIRYLERALNFELNNLDVYEAEIIPTVAITPTSCSTLTQAQSQQLIKKLECALQKTLNLTTTISTIGNATLKIDLERRSSLQYLYLQQIKLALQNRCQQPQTIASSALFYNFNNSAQNWVYGSITPSDIVGFYQQLAEHGTVTTCPADKPYIKLGSTECFNCQAPNNVFDLTTQECISCPGNTTLNTTTHQCQCPCDLDYLLTEEGLCIPKTVIYSNGDYLNIAGLTAESVKSYVNEIQAAQQQPNVVAGKCAADENSALTICVKCQPGERFIVDYRRCQVCPHFNQSTMICKYNPILNSTSTTTPPTPTPTPTSTTVITTTTTTVVQPVAVSPVSVSPIAVDPTSTSTSTSSVSPMSTSPTSTAPSTTSTNGTTTTTATTSTETSNPV